MWVYLTISEEGKQATSGLTSWDQPPMVCADCPHVCCGAQGSRKPGIGIFIDEHSLWFVQFICFIIKNYLVCEINKLRSDQLFVTIECLARFAVSSFTAINCCKSLNAQLRFRSEKLFDTALYACWFCFTAILGICLWFCFIAILAPRRTTRKRKYMLSHVEV